MRIARHFLMHLKSQGKGAVDPERDGRSCALYAPLSHTLRCMWRRRACTSAALRPQVASATPKQAASHGMPGACAHTCMHSHTYTHQHTHTYASAHTRTRTRANTHTRTYIQDTLQLVRGPHQVLCVWLLAAQTPLVMRPMLCVAIGSTGASHGVRHLHAPIT